MSRKYPHIPVHIVEYHNEALDHIYRSIGSKYLPLKDILLLHFDSHPDMIIPDMTADVFFEKKELFESLSIENWIVPSLYAGHISSVVWFKAPWANQMAEQTGKFLIGREKSSSRVKVTSKDDYFLSECLFCAENDLENMKEIDFHVETCREKLSEVKKSFFSELEENKSYILDIDLDFFSTKNPIKEMFSDEDYETLKSIYEFLPPRTRSDEDIKQCLDERRKKLLQLKKMLKYIENEEDEDDAQLESGWGDDLRWKTDKIDHAQTDNFPEQSKENIEVKCNIYPIKDGCVGTSEEIKVEEHLEEADFQVEDDLHCKKPKLMTEGKDDLSLKEKLLDGKSDALHLKHMEESSFKEAGWDDPIHKKDVGGTGKQNDKVLEKNKPRPGEDDLKLEPENKESKKAKDFLLPENDIPTFENLKGIYARMKDVADADLLHDFGCTCDDPELPHHVSTDHEVDELLESVERYLGCINHPPTIVTISRSSEDEYCPPEQVETIQKKVENLLRKIYGTVDFIHHYKTKL